MKLKNEKKALQMFCAEEDIMHQQLLKPHYNQRDGGKLMATDGRIMLTIDPAKVSIRCKYDQESLPVVAPHNAGIGKRISFDSIEEAYRRFKLVPEMVSEDGQDDECPECMGTGTVEYTYECDTNGKTYYHEDDCPVCEGTGRRDVKMVPTGRMLLPPKSVFRIGDVTFKAAQLWRAVEALRLLGFDSMTWQTAHTGGANLFDICDGIQFITMSWSIPKGETDVIIEDVNTESV